MVLDVQSWDYVPMMYNNFISEGLMIQMTYSGSAEIGQWTKLHPGTQTSIALHAVQSTVRLQERSILNPFTLFDSKVGKILIGYELRSVAVLSKIVPDSRVNTMSLRKLYFILCKFS